MPALEIDCRTLKSRLDANETVLLVDEYEIARIAGARLLPMSEFAEKAGELEGDGAKEREIVVYCHHGTRSLRVAHWLRQHGYPNAVSLKGGIEAWSQEIDSNVPRY